MSFEFLPVHQSGCPSRAARRWVAQRAAVRDGIRVAAVVGVTLAACVAAPPALAQFVEPDVTVLHVLTDPTGGVNDAFGWAVAHMADIDQDGAQEAIVGSPFRAANSGAAFVYSGRTGQRIHTLTGSPNWQLGYAIADAGDVNGDGVSDVIAGAPGSGAGRALIYSGANGSLLRTLNGAAAADQFGAAVGGLGDVDGDGRSDVAVGAPLNDAGGGNAGRVYVYSGATGALIRTHTGARAADQFGIGVSGAGDVNGDGRGDVIVGARNAEAGQRGAAFVFSGADGSLLLPALLPNQTTGADLGWFFVAGVGDVNADGVSDLYGGDFNDNALGGFSGRAYVWSGADGSLLHQFSGAAGAGMGPGRGCGDVDGDAQADLIVGSYTSSNGGAMAGRIDIFSGRTGQIIRTMTSMTAGENFGFDAVGMGDVNEDCATDLLCSAASGNTVYIVSGLPAPGNGDANGDGLRNLADIGPLWLAISDFDAWLAANPGVSPCNLDMNGDLQIDCADWLAFRSVVPGARRFINGACEPNRLIQNNVPQ